MDITEKRLPQDGRANLQINNTDVDVRISSICTVNGEKIVIRLLNRKTFLKDKIELGFSEDATKEIDNIVDNKSGILLITGTTGSGKTTTVYSILKDLIDSEKNIMTIEDPVEYKMDKVNQIQVNKKIGLSFEVGLRSILRQDPDIIMIGEIRDEKTAQIAIRAATTGHLVLATLHSRDSIGAIFRLKEMGIPTYLINESLIGIISQRLIKKICSYCSHEIIIKEICEEVNTKLSLGCEMCENKGYKGRTVSYEIIKINESIKNAIKSNKDSNQIREIAIENNMILSSKDNTIMSEHQIINSETYMQINENM